MSQQLQSSFRALGDPTRRAILTQLSQEELTISEVVERFDLTRTAVRKHLTILEEGQLITITPRGKERITRLNPKGLKVTAEWFDDFSQYWDSALLSLASAIDREKRNSRGKKK